MRLHFAAKQVQDAGQTRLLQHPKSADIVKTIRDHCFCKKAKLPDMEQHPRVVFSQQCHVEGTIAGRDMMEAYLVSEDGFACSGRALKDKGAAAQKTTAQYRVQPRHPGRYAFEGRRVLRISEHWLCHAAIAAALR